MKKFLSIFISFVLFVTSACEKKNTTNEGISGVEVTVFPNPATSTVSVAVRYSLPQPLTIKVFDSNAQKIAERGIQSGTMPGIIQIDLRDRPVGVYHVVVTNGDKQLIQKFIKQ